MEDSLKHHIILVGPEGVGKTKLAEHLNKVHKRGVIDMKDIIDWAWENKTEGGQRARQYLD